MPSEYPNVLKISAGDYWCIQNNGCSIEFSVKNGYLMTSFLSPNLKFME